MGRLIAAAAVCLLAASPAGAQDAGTPEAVAEAYLAAYQALDFDTLETLYAQDAVFIDPTSEAVDGIDGPFHWTGPEAIVAGIRGWGATRLEYTIDRQFEASGRVVFDGHLASISETEAGRVAYIFPIVTIVTVEDGRVTEHRDYTDFSGMTREAR